MPQIIINRSQISINKFLIYAILMSALLYPTLIKNIYYAVTFKKTKGEIVSFIVTKSTGSKRVTRYYPDVEFIVGDTIYRCIGSQYEHEGFHLHESVPVIYNPKNPAKSFSYSFSGFWIPELVYVIPLALMLTLMVFLDSIPKYLTLRF